MSETLGRYEILRLLGRGGMAEVFLARRRSGGGIEKRLVLKRIRSERATDPRLMQLFVREARVSMALSHQNIVPVFDFGRAGDALFLAMELVDGRDLGAVLVRARERGEAVDPLLVAFIGAECCAALAYAHARRFEDGTVGVVHRDVTPRNVLLSWSGEVRLTDFGVAALRGAEAEGVRGTPGYMAPEQARGETVDGRADLYALGLVLLEAATGRAVRPADQSVALEMARAGKKVAVDEVADGLREVIAKAVAPERFDRWESARKMRDALDGVVARLRAERGAPSNLLADWLRALFGPPGATAEREVEKPRPFDAVTFLDDGEGAVIGSGTAKSIAGTKDDAAPAEPQMAAAPAPAAAAAAAPAPAPAPAAATSRRRSWITLLAVVALGGAVAAAVAMTGEPSSSARPDAAVEAAAPPDATVVAVVPPDAAPVPPDAAPAPTPPDAGSRRRPRPDPARDAAPTATARRKVTINSRPWSQFWVDGGPIRHETPETIELTEGTHQIRFVNEAANLEKTIELEVPDHDIKHVEVLVN